MDSSVTNVTTVRARDDTPPWLERKPRSESYSAWAGWARKLLAEKGHPTTNRIDRREDDDRVTAAAQVAESRAARPII